MLPHTREFTRDGCIVGARLVTYQQLEQRYVCRECGGSPVTKANTDGDTTIWWAECGKCGHRDFTSKRFYDQQCADFKTILWRLPDKLRELVVKPTESLTAERAIAELFD